MRSVLSGAHIQHGVARLQLAGVNANEGQLADERVGHDLECQRRERLLVVGLAGNLCAVVGIDAVGFADIERRRQIVDDRVEQRLHTFVLERGSYHHRKNFKCDGRLRSEARSSSAVISSPSRNLCRISSSFSATVSTSCAWKASAFFFSSAGISSVIVLGAHGVVFPDDRLHVDQIDDAFELVFLADGNLDRDGLGAEALADGIDRHARNRRPSCRSC